MYCQQCGYKNAEGAKFCNSCGAAITLSSQDSEQNHSLQSNEKTQPPTVQKQASSSNNYGWGDESEDEEEETDEEDESETSPSMPEQPIQKNVVQSNSSSYTTPVIVLLVINALIILVLVLHAFYYSYISKTSFPISVWVVLVLFLVLFWAYGRSLSNLAVNNTRGGFSNSEVTTGMGAVLFAGLIFLGGLGLYASNAIALVLNIAASAVSASALKKVI